MFNLPMRVYRARPRLVIRIVEVVDEEGYPCRVAFARGRAPVVTRTCSGGRQSVVAPGHRIARAAVRAARLEEQLR